MMNQEALFKKIGSILAELNDQYDFLAQNPQQLNELELELFHANANFLADHVQIIKKINLTESAPLEIAAEGNPKTIELEIAGTASAEEEFSEGEDKLFIEESIAADEVEPDIREIEEEVFKLDEEPSSFEFILNDHAEHEKFEFEEKSVDEIFNRPLSEEEENILARKKILNNLISDSNGSGEEDEDDEIGPEPFLVAKPSEKEEPPVEAVPVALRPGPAPEPVKTPEPVAAAVSQPITDSFDGKAKADPGSPAPKPTINELLAAKPEQYQPLANPINDLKQGINLNDKLLYIKELFNGYNLAYAEAIDLANKLPNFEAADNFFQKNYALKNNWADKQATVDKFYQLLNQRFK